MFSLPSFIPCSISNYIRHFKIAFTSDEEKEISLTEKFEDYTRIFGYSSRSLFNIFMCEFVKQNPDAKVLCTPFNYDSTIDILNKYIKKENIVVCEIENLNTICELKSKNNFDLVLITHILGQDLKVLSFINSLDNNPLIVENRILGGNPEIGMSNYADISFYSMEMDKIPTALGGGFVLVKNTKGEIIDSLNNSIKNCEKETNCYRILNLLSILPLYFIYNCTLIMWIISFIIKSLKHLFPKLGLNMILTNYKKLDKKYGFKNIRPSNALITSMKYSCSILDLYDTTHVYKHKMFMDSFTELEKNKYFPWLKDTLYTRGFYNPIYFENSDNLIKKLDINNISCIKCPTYKLITFRENTYKFITYGENYSKQKKFLDDLIYLPSLQLLSLYEIRILAKLIKTTDH